ncbi:hypothetical protein EVAR_59814_1 [Eumeta japonica]|uniref:Uncharacterized protein n=1 Tax=Eumeta variegata TaxID=151549 RepID=A0A4C1YEZ9_EUMVA|nr:hypothetical protein EVAR_59814_1 [Eumeta japonica]
MGWYREGKKNGEKGRAERSPGKRGRAGKSKRGTLLSRLQESTGGRRREARGAGRPVLLPRENGCLLIADARTEARRPTAEWKDSVCWTFKARSVEAPATLQKAIDAGGRPSRASRPRPEHQHRRAAPRRSRCALRAHTRGRRYALRTPSASVLSLYLRHLDPATRAPEGEAIHLPRDNPVRAHFCSTFRHLERAVQSERRSTQEVKVESKPAAERYRARPSGGIRLFARRPARARRAPLMWHRESSRAVDSRSSLTRTKRGMVAQ